MTTTQKTTLARSAFKLLFFCLAVYLTTSTWEQFFIDHLMLRKLLLAAVFYLLPMDTGYRIYRWVLDAFKRRAQKQAGAKVAKGSMHVGYGIAEQNPWAKPVAIICGVVGALLSFVVIKVLFAVLLRKFYV